MQEFQKDLICFKCKQKGHYAINCRNSRYQNDFHARRNVEQENDVVSAVIQASRLKSVQKQNPDLSHNCATSVQFHANEELVAAVHQGVEDLVVFLRPHIVEDVAAEYPAVEPVVVPPVASGSTAVGQQLDDPVSGVQQPLN